MSGLTMSHAPIRWEIALQPHLRHRMRERCPGLKPARAVDEVRAALTAGRISSDRPSWLGPPRDHRHDISLYAWSEDQERCYVMHSTENKFVVMSVLIKKLGRVA